MIGDKRLDMPEHINEALEIHRQFNFSFYCKAEVIMDNARRLVELNNEVYDKLHLDMPKGTAKNQGIDC